MAVSWGQVDMVVGDEVRSGAPLIITKGEHCGMVISEQLLPIVQVGKFHSYRTAPADGILCGLCVLCMCQWLAADW